MCWWIGESVDRPRRPAEQLAAEDLPAAAAVGHRLRVGPSASPPVAAALCVSPLIPATAVPRSVVPK
ncbi:hypothetical protein AS594_24375 [Streptomyces agglomeratus]|uniref:Uncharacterized protein n=1 Tax=Streptomyces agglomeratus TaxID=285458 RepID=A0A1E5PC91_9ACTN|nr:hypothetical protein AS594_24375 [Streptomyces agglomeratus]